MCAASWQHWQPSQENWSRWESHFIDADLEMVSPDAHVTVKSVLYKEPTRLHGSASHDAVVQVVSSVCVVLGRPRVMLRRLWAVQALRMLFRPGPTPDPSTRRWQTRWHSPQAYQSPHRLRIHDD